MTTTKRITTRRLSQAQSCRIPALGFSLVRCPLRARYASRTWTSPRRKTTRRSPLACPQVRRLGGALPIPLPGVPGIAGMVLRIIPKLTFRGRRSPQHGQGQAFQSSQQSPSAAATIHPTVRQYPKRDRNPGRLQRQADARPRKRLEHLIGFETHRSEGILDTTARAATQQQIHQARDSVNPDGSYNSGRLLRQMLFLFNATSLCAVWRRRLEGRGRVETCRRG